jgi:hypothetical protein
MRTPVIVPEDLGNGRAERRSLMRVCTAMALGSRQGVAPKRVLETWNDSRAEMILRAASSPTTTTTAAALGLQSTKILPMLAPASASARLLAMARTLDLTGLQSIRLPYIGLAGRPPVPFIAEGAPANVIDLTVSAVALGPVHKLLICAALTREMMAASAENATVIIGDAIAVSAAQSLDSVLFSNAAASATTPAGLLNGVTAIPSSAGATGAAAVAADLALLANAIGAAGINPDGMVIITTPALAVKVRVLASPMFTNTVLSSASLAAGTVIAIVKEGLATGYSGAVEIDAGTDATLHFESASPLPLVDGSGVVAAPIYSAWQQDMTILKIHGDVAWTVHPGAIAQVTGASW